MNHSQSQSVIFKCLGLLLCVAALAFNSFELRFLQGLDSEIKFAAVSISLLLLADIILFIKSNRAYSVVILQSLNPLKLNKKMRVSMAYLLQIRIDGEYLLVYHSGRKVYQPVGGVYKYNPVAVESLLESFSMARDKDSVVDNGQYDLRLYLYKRRKLLAFLNWFSKDSDRESDPWREFYEELVEPGILHSKIFYYIDYNKKRSVIEPIYFDEYRKIDTFYYADIFELNWTNEEQLRDMRRLMKSTDTRYVWASSSDIERGYKIVDGVKQVIASNTWKIVHNCKRITKERTTLC
jgi:hypothetical protein